MENDMKPCPFCGSECELIAMKHVPFKSENWDYTPRCKDPSCPGRITKKYASRALAIAKWNRRVNDG